MSVTSATTNSQNAIAATLHQFTPDEYLQMVYAGILGEDDHVELLDGVIVDISPMGLPHAAIVTHLSELLWDLRMQGCIFVFKCR